MNATEKERHSNYDFLRILSCIAVIVIHISGVYVGAVTDEEVFGEVYTEHIPTIYIWNTLSRFAVSCFMMLTGAFAFSDKNRDFKTFYRKSFIKIGIPTIVFSILYFLFKITTGIIAVIINDRPLTILIPSFTSVLKGAPYYHMWYLYTLIGIYILIPILIRIKDEVGEKKFNIISWVYLFIVACSGMTSTFLLEWSASKVVLYLAFIMIGYEIRRYCCQRKNTAKGIAFIILGFCMEGLLCFLRYQCVLKGIAEENGPFSLLSDFNPMLIAANILFFAGFSLIELKKVKCGKLSEWTFYIYLFHAGVWTVVNRVIVELKLESDCRIVIPVSVVLVFLISLLLSYVYKKIWNCIDRKLSISDRMCRIVHLQ